MLTHTHSSLSHHTVPIIVAIIMGLIMMCLGNPRQMMGMPLSLSPDFGRQEEGPQVMGSNPVYNQKYPQEGARQATW